MKTNKIIVVLLTLLINISLDRISKLFAITLLRNKQPLFFLHNTMILTYAENQGAFLSLGHDWNIIIKYSILLIIPIIICFLAIWYCLSHKQSILRIIFIITIVSGGLSNLFDRLFNNFSVIDFINLGIGNIRTGILNVADLSVTFGMVLFIIYELKNGRKSIYKN